MIRESEKWREVREKQQELRALVDQNWKNEEWRLAALGESVLRTVEEGQAAADDMRNQANSYQEIVEKYQRLVNGNE